MTPLRLIKKALTFFSHEIEALEDGEAFEVRWGSLVVAVQITPSGERFTAALWALDRRYPTRLASATGETPAEALEELREVCP
jgi:hypothetical protein